MKKKDEIRSYTFTEELLLRLIRSPTAWFAIFLMAFATVGLFIMIIFT